MGKVVKRVLLTGADGYIGAIMGPKLLEAGYEVRGADTGFYRRGWLFDDGRSHPEVRSLDQRRLTVDDLRGFDAVVHLAELSNDPIGENDPGLTMAINHEGSVNLGRMAREAGVKRFIQASSCSCYGAGGDEMRTETSALAPQTAYARCKILVEEGLKDLRDDDFTPVFMRNATAYGASPRQRFDLVLNNLCGFAHTTREIRMTSDGMPWRPITHIEDICEAMLCALKAPKDAVSGEAFNVGADSENYRIREIAEIVARTFPGCELTVGDSRRRHPQLPGLLRQDPRAHAGVQDQLDRRARRAPAQDGVRPHRADFRDVRGAAVHPAQGAQAPARYRPGRRDALLDRPRAGLNRRRRPRPDDQP